MEYIWPGIIAAQAIYAATKLRIPDLLAPGPKSVAELASDCAAHPPTLQRLLRALASIEMFALEPDGRFCNTPLTEVLRADHPESQRESVLFLPAPFLWRPLGELYDSVRTGEPAFPRIFGQHFFQYLSAHPNDAEIFNTVMTQGIQWTTPALLAAYDFSRFQCIVDVGGGEGALLRDILAATPELRGILFDLPQVVAGAPAILSGDVAVRCQIVSGSFFDSVPEGASAYLMKGVIHDWPDDDARQDPSEYPARHPSGRYSPPCRESCGFHRAPCWSGGHADAGDRGSRTYRSGFPVPSRIHPILSHQHHRNGGILSD